jgi:hypothetical protein
MKSRRLSHPKARIFSAEIHPAGDGSYRVRLIVNREMLDKIEYAKSLARDLIPDFDDSQLFGLAFKALAEKERAKSRRTWPR